MPRKVQNGRRFADGGVNSLRVANIDDLDLDTVAVTLLQPRRVLLGAIPREVVEHQNAVAARRQSVGNVATYETTAARNENGFDIAMLRGAYGAHATSPRISSSAVAPSIRSTAT